MPKKKLIEVALPLEAINAQSAREKSIRHGHPSTLHLWWARRPLATARAVLFAQLVDDPGENAAEYRAEAEHDGVDDVEGHVAARVDAERQRLFDLIARMVDWDNLGDDSLFDQVRAEIRRSTGGRPPAILDPFAGGGTIPLEAQRLGLEAHASDLNPVAVLINKALIEIPPRFADRPPVFPGAEGTRNAWERATGLAEDVRRYGEWMRDEAERRIGHLYPKARLDDGTEASVIAWIWARTVTCPNPACGIEMPLVRSWWLGRKKGKEAYVVPTVVDGRVEFSIGHDPKLGPTKENDGTVGRQGAHCVSCAAAVSLKYIREQGRDAGLGTQLMALVSEGRRQRIYLAPNAEHRAAAEVIRPNDVPAGELAANPRDFKTPNYGMRTFASLFTNRQLTALTTFSDLVGEARERVLKDAVAAGLPQGARLEQGGTDAAAYADAVATYLGFIVNKHTARNNTMCGWESGMDRLRGSFQRQAVPMSWDFAEAQPLGTAGGGFTAVVISEAEVLDALPNTRFGGLAQQADAASRSYGGVVISTDPPYYDNIGYSDLSDFFYVWLRRSLRSIHPDLLSTMLVPKSEELVANPYRHGGREQARDFFEHGFEDVFSQARISASDRYPIAVYYAFKQSESDAQGTASTGWETLLASMVRAGWTVTATWPARSEMASRMIASGTNALASSIVLALRPRPEDAPIIDRRGFLNELKTILPQAMQHLLQGAIAPVDMEQAMIGPGMAIFSKFSRVIEPSGKDMSVRDALRAINRTLDDIRTDQEGELDEDTRWCVSWFDSHGFDVAPYGEAETLASAKNASVAGLARAGVISSGSGNVKLLAPDELPEEYDPRIDDRISLWEVVLHMSRALTERGLDDTGRILAAAEERGLDMAIAPKLAERLFAISTKRGLTQSGVLFNTLGSSWPEVRAAAASAADRTELAPAPTLDFDLEA